MLAKHEIKNKNMIKIRKTINFDYINEWVIVYNGTELIDNPKIFGLLR